MVMNVAAAMNAYHKTTTSALSPSQGEDGFGDVLKSYFGDSVATIKQAEKAATDGAVGKASMQDVVMAVDKAGMVLDTIVAIRDRVVSAYQEIQRMTV
jgi:flagellar hook-basal body complex protein FliE